MNLFIILLLLNLLTFVSLEFENKTYFKPTKEWQPILEGQVLPAGLHVRINLKSGQKEAKLNEKKSSSALITTNNIETEYQENISSPEILTKELEQALKDLETSGIVEGDTPTNNRYRSYETIKKEFESINMSIKTDSEIINHLIEEFGNKTKTDKNNNEKHLLAILDDLEYFVHQIDNSLWFIQKGGLDLILLPTLVNQSNINLTKSSLKLLGSLVQNNPKAQIEIFENNFGKYLTQILLTTKDSGILSAALYAFGCLLRKFPHAQKDILSKNGINTLLTLLKSETETRIKTKVLVIISDLILEKQYALNMDLEPTNADKIQQYREIYLETWLLEGNFCRIFDIFLNKNINNITKNANIADNIIQSAHIISDICIDKWSNMLSLKDSITFLQNKYKGLQEEYLIEIANNIDMLMVKLFGKAVKKDEL